MMLALALLMIGTPAEVFAGKKDKKDKGVKWEWDGTKSGNKVIDDYLETITKCFNRMEEYKNSMDTFVMKDDTLEINGKYYIMTHMVDGEGQLVTRSRVNWQCAEAYAQGGVLVLDMTNAGLGSANAALELTNLGLKGLKYAKYVKGGPNVVSEGVKTIKTIRGKWLQNSRNWKAMKDGAIKDAASIKYDKFTPDVVAKLNKCYYIREIDKSAPEYAEVVKYFTGKTPEEIAKEAEAKAQEIAAANMLPEDKSKALDKEPDLEEELNS